jgi:hypothetical protein
MLNKNPSSKRKTLTATTLLTLLISALLCSSSVVSVEAASMWTQTYGGEGAGGIASEWAYSVVETSDSGYALAGYTGPSVVGSAFLLIKTDEYGVAPEASWVVLPVLLAATLAIFICKKKLLPTHKTRTRMERL